MDNLNIDKLEYDCDKPEEVLDNNDVCQAPAPLAQDLTPHKQMYDLKYLKCRTTQKYC